MMQTKALRSQLCGTPGGSKQLDIADMTDLAEMDFIEHNLIRMSYPPEPCDKR